MKRFILVGYSGHSYVVIDTIHNNGDEVLGYFRSEEKQRNPYELDWLGDERNPETVERYRAEGAGIVLAVGDNGLRRKLFGYFEEKGFSLPAVRNKDAWLSDKSVLHKGCFVAHGCQVNALSVIGRGTILNTDTVIEHECEVGEFVNVAPGAVLLGSVIVEEGAFIGANAVIRQGVTVGQDAVIGQGAVVVKDVPPGETWIGNPAGSMGAPAGKSRKTSKSHEEDASPLVRLWKYLTRKLTMVTILGVNNDYFRHIFIETGI